MDDAQLLRYSRHILLDEIGIEGQERILKGRALIVGAGGLGSPVALYLASAGVGHITIVDDDVVDLTNLQRQIAHTTARVGQSKAQSAKLAMAAINPQVEVNAVVARAKGDVLDALVADADVVFDCTDNFKTRHAINAVCVLRRKALVSGAAIRFDGQISVFDLRHNRDPVTEAITASLSPCYACMFPPDENFEEVACATMGVLAPLVGIIGAMQAAEGLKLLCGAGHSLSGRLLMLDALNMEFSEIRSSRDPDCVVCGVAAA